MELNTISTDQQIQNDQSRIISPPSPSYNASQFDTIIIRRQRTRPYPNALKLPYSALSRTSTNSLDSTHYPPPLKLARLWQFAGWGISSHLEISESELNEAEMRRIEEKKEEGDGVLGSWLATGVAGVAVAGSPFYAFPAVVAVASVYSPLSLLIATSLLYCWRPIMVELANALPLSGANYIYLLNASPMKYLALLAAALTLLDDLATAVVSAATAANYLSDQINLPFSNSWLCILILLGIGFLGVLGVKEGAGVTSGVLGFHLLVMATLFIMSIMYWIRYGSAILIDNWHQGQPGNPSGIVESIVEGICLGFLALTGFETTPDYISSLRPKVYPQVLLNLQFIALALNGPLMLVVFVVLPLDSIKENDSILNLLGELVGGRWLKILVTVDAVAILCGGVLTGIISATALTTRLTSDRILPRVFLKKLPYTGSNFVSLILFIGLSIILYASSGASLSIISAMFAITFLSTMFLYPLCLLLIIFTHPTLLSTPRRPSLLLPLLTLLLSTLLIIGNIILSPSSLVYFLAYEVGIGLIIIGMNSKSGGMGLVWWGLDWIQGEKEGEVGGGGGGKGGRIERWKEGLVKKMKEFKKGAIVVFVKSDEINRLFEMILYVRKNEDTGNIKLIHFYKDVEFIPSELESNYKILDEAFPGITIDLIYIQGTFTPSIISVISERFKVPRTLCFMGCPNLILGFTLGEFDGVRVII